MLRHLTALCLALLLVPQDSIAQSHDRIGYGRLFTNDFFVDGQDRWRTGSFASSRIWAQGWDGKLPQRPGEVIELRLWAEIMAPSTLKKHDPGDRPYAGTISAAMYTHFNRAGTDVALGAGISAVGPQTRLDDLQDAFHDLLGLKPVTDAVRADQVGNGFYPLLVAEAGRDVPLIGNATLRPFLEARAGAETLIRVGADLTLGNLLQGDLLVREPVGGQRYRTIPGTQSGYAVVLGADVADVVDSVYFPASAGVTMRDTRIRYRGGLHWQSGRYNAFYGLTYLDKEFEEQPEGQLVGSLRLDVYF